MTPQTPAVVRSPRCDAGTSAAAPGEAPLSLPGAVCHQLLGQVAHYHLTRDERLACEVEHAALMARLSAVA